MQLEDIRRARDVIAGAIHETPLRYSRTFSEMAGREVYLKPENLQKTGSFKVRGAYNRITAFTEEERRRGAIAASAGNHAQGVALAAREAGISCTVVMPREASLSKIEATIGYGANVILHGDDFGQCMQEAERLAQERGSVFVPAYDDSLIIAGQGTIGFEILDDLPDVDIVVAPLGGGGLLGGIALAIKEQRPQTIVIGVQAEAAQGASEAFRTGDEVYRAPHTTLADGIAVPQVGSITLDLLRAYVDDIVAVTEEEIAHAMVILLERAKLMVEGAGATPLAALLAGRLPAAGRKVALVLSGGNVDLNLLTHVLDSGLAHAGRFLSLRARLLDRPGRLAHLLRCVADAQVNVLDVVHTRGLLHIPIGQVEVDLTLEMRGPGHQEKLADELVACGYTLLEDPNAIRRGRLDIAARELESDV